MSIPVFFVVGGGPLRRRQERRLERCRRQCRRSQRPRRFGDGLGVAECRSDMSTTRTSSPSQSCALISSASDVVTGAMLLMAVFDVSPRRPSRTSLASVRCFSSTASRSEALMSGAASASRRSMSGSAASASRARAIAARFDARRRACLVFFDFPTRHVLTPPTTISGRCPLSEVSRCGLHSPIGHRTQAARDDPAQAGSIWLYSFQTFWILDLTDIREQHTDLLGGRMVTIGSVSHSSFYANVGKPLLDVAIGSAMLVSLAPILVLGFAAGWMSRTYRRELIVGLGGLAVTVGYVRPASTPIGRWVQRHRLDYLLLIPDVLIGRLSIIGPQRMPITEADHYPIPAARPGMVEVPMQPGTLRPFHPTWQADLSTLVYGFGRAVKGVGR